MVFEFYEEKNFKNTEIGELPVDWEVVRLKEIGKILTGTTPPKNVKEYWINGEIDFVKPPDLQNAIITTASEKVSKKALKQLKLAGEGSVLVSCIGILGRVGYAIKPIAFNQQINAVIPQKEKAHGLFLFYALQTQTNQIESLKSMTTVPIVNKSKFSEVKIPLPPLQEQKAIARVLRAVQSAKESTEKVINATKELKKSLMKHLFTYGPVPVDEIEKVPLKETEIGLIPQHWEVVRLGEIVDFYMGRTPPREETESWEDGIFPWVTIADMKDYGYIKSTKEKVSAFAINKYFKDRISPKGTLLMSFKLTIGRTSILEIDAVHNEAIISLFPKENKLDKYFLFYLLPSVKYENYMDRVVKGSTLNKSKLEKVKIPLPPIQEQKTIADILKTIDQKIQKEEQRKKALENLFKSLLSQLMTGKIRIKILENHGIIS